MTTASRHDPIKKIKLKDGRIVYRFVIDTGMKPRLDKLTGKPMLDATGRQVFMRDQRTFTFPTRREATEERARILADKSRGTLVRATRKTVAEHLAEHLAGRRTIRE